MRLGVVVAAVSLSIIGLATADDVRASIKRPTNIPSQGLGTALQTLAKDRNFQVVYVSEEVNGLRTHGAVGEFTSEEALKQLLSGTGMTFRYLDEKTVTIVRVSSAAPSGGSAPAPAATPPATSTPPGDSQKEGQKSLWDTFRVAQVDQGAPMSSPTLTKTNEPASEKRPELQEVIVTAQKREERLQNVPISIGVLRGEQLDRSTFQGVEEALNTVPGVVAQQSYIGGDTQLAIRGVAASMVLLHGSSPIAYYLDSVPFGLVKTSIAPDSNAYDLQRIEVLRGPQGTLYGASALNGVVRVLTNDADLNNFELKVRGSDSSTEDGGNNYRGDMALNVPIIEGRLAARAVFGYEDDAGWIDRPNEKDANFAILRNYRAKVNAEPTDGLTIGLSTWSSRDNYGEPSWGLANGKFPNPVNEPMVTDFDTDGLKLGYRGSAFSVSSATSYLHYFNSGQQDLTPFGVPQVPFINQLRANNLSEEVNVNSQNTNVWRWSLGGMYRDESDRVFQTAPGVLSVVDFTDTSTSYAIYGELTRLFLGGRVELTAGTRYFSDDESTKENVPSNGLPANTPLIRVGSHFEKTTPRIVLTWHANDQLMTYASYGEGFRSGFQQQPNVIRAAPEIPAVKADDLKNYEVGAKDSFWNGRMSFEAAVYYIDWRNVQTDNAILIGVAPIAALVNGQSASGVGTDLAVAFHPADGLDLGVSYSVNGLEWDSNVVTAEGSTIFNKGDRLSLSPHETIGGAVDYNFPIGGTGYRGKFSASANYSSATYIKIATGFGQANSILITRASYSLEFPQHWGAMLYVDNINNESGVIQQAPFNIPVWALRPRPRTIGVQGQYSFR